MDEKAKQTEYAKALAHANMERAWKECESHLEDIERIIATGPGDEYDMGIIIMCCCFVAAQVHLMKGDRENEGLLWEGEST